LQPPKTGEDQASENTLETFNNDYEDLEDFDDTTEDSEDHECEFKVLLRLDGNQPIDIRKRKSVSLCRHKLQG
jgi:hypothetical protein